jgi:hypothetical protein
VERFFFLDDTDRALTDRRHGDHNWIGFELHHGTVRYLGTFFPDPLNVPWPVVEHPAAQFGLAADRVSNGMTNGWLPGISTPGDLSGVWLPGLVGPACPGGAARVH